MHPPNKWNDKVILSVRFGICDRFQGVMIAPAYDLVEVLAVVDNLLVLRSMECSLIFKNSL